MLKYFPWIIAGFSFAVQNDTCTSNLQCIPLSECEEIKLSVESDNFINYVRSLSCGYFHEPYVCCDRNCVTPNGNFGRKVSLDECLHLKRNELTTNQNKKKFLINSYVNQTHVCCGNNEEEYKLVPPAPVDVPVGVLNSTCVTPNGENSICTHIYDCPAYTNAALQNNNYFRFVNDSFCGYWKSPMVCCGDVSAYKENYSTNLPSSDKCGLWNSVVDQNVAPWLALIKVSGSVDLCVGVLINHQYLLSSIICTGHDHKKMNVQFSSCIINNANNYGCNFKITQTKLFPLHNYLHSEDTGVVLLKLEKPVTISNIVPVCLPNSPLPVLQHVNVMGIEEYDRTRYLGKTISAITAFNDDCYFGTSFNYICMKTKNVSLQLPFQYTVLRLENKQWYLEGIFNWRKWDTSISNYFQAIYVYKFLPWMKSNIS